MGNEIPVIYIGNEHLSKEDGSYKIHHFDSIVEYKKFKNSINPSIIIIEKKDNDSELISLCLESFKFKNPLVTIFIVPTQEESSTLFSLFELGADFVVRKGEIINIDDLLDSAYKRYLYKTNVFKYVSFLEEKMKEEERTLKESKERLNQQFKATIVAITNALGIKSEYTSGHSKRVAKLVVKLGERLGIVGEELELLEYAGLLHDIGKIGVPDYILNKPTQLTPEEYNEVKKHSVYSTFILKDIPGFEKVKEAALHEHERYDGKGYPGGLKGDEIPLFARIIAVCDTWDSCIYDRVYRKAMTKEAAIEELRKNAGTQFDPKIVEVFLELVNTGEI
ncbi:MAG: HD-GYP domain-containing protein [Planctomycetota bacterium]